MSPMTTSSKKSPKKKPSKKAPIQLAYKITITHGELKIGAPPSGRLTADVEFDGRTSTEKCEITGHPDGSFFFQLVESNLPEWMARTVVGVMNERWGQMQAKVLEDILSGNVIPQRPS